MEDSVNESGTRKERSDPRQVGWFQLLKALEGNRIISLGLQLLRAQRFTTKRVIMIGRSKC